MQVMYPKANASILTLPFCFLVKAGAKVIFCGREGMSIFLITACQSP